ncbi:MAG: nitroreductase family protein [Sedimentibacter sp.]
MAKDFYTSFTERRTFYGISKEQIVSDERLQLLIERALKFTPSAFNSQSARAVLLLGQQHDRFWEITMDTLRKIVPADNFQPTEDKINSFKSGYGTVLYYEDRNVVEGLQNQFPTYSENFPKWSEQSNGMMQLVVWTALQDLGYGASLQHYTELVEGTVSKEWNLPSSWKLIGQMPFGKPTADSGDKEFNFTDEDLKVFK